VILNRDFQSSNVLLILSQNFLVLLRNLLNKFKKKAISMVTWFLEYLVSKIKIKIKIKVKIKNIGNRVLLSLKNNNSNNKILYSKNQNRFRSRRKIKFFSSHREKKKVKFNRIWR
jgi:hypothetical protein